MEPTGVWSGAHRRVRSRLIHHLQSIYEYHCVFIQSVNIDGSAQFQAL